MRNFKKYFLILPFTALAGVTLTGCGKEEEKRVIRILNCEDYIYEYEEGDEEYSSGGNDYKMDMMDQFVEYWAKTHDGEEIDYVYDTFDTNETMFNELKTGKTTYDVIIPSDYMIQKLLSNNMLHKISDANLESLWTSISPYLKEKFHGITAKLDGIDTEIYNYSVPYMWGTVGVMYNPNFYEDLEEDEVHELMMDWDSLYGEKFKNSFSIKDSVRDTYAVSLVHTFRDEISKTTDNAKLTSIFNRHDKETMAKVKEDMLKLKENAFGFECDSGKTDMTTEKIGANMCWSGDATWAITEARESDLDLYYSIPTGSDGKGASNVWFDGFCIPESKDLDAELAEEFIKFMSQPENAVQNCYCVGYTPGVAGDAMLDYVYDCYDVRGSVIDGEDISELVENEDYIKYDLSYFFKDSFDEYKDIEDVAVIYADPDVVGRELTAQYPEASILDRLAIMNDFGSEGNQALLDMWEQVRTNPLPLWAIILFIVEGLAVGAFVSGLIARKVIRKKLKEQRK